MIGPRISVATARTAVCGFLDTVMYVRPAYSPRTPRKIIRTPVDEYPRFLSAVSYLGALGPSRAIDALTERASHLSRRIDEATGVLEQTVGARVTPRLFMIEVEFAVHAWAAELDWTQRTIAEIRDVPHSRFAWTV